MENSDILTRYKDVLIRGAQEFNIPTNVPCPCRCRFCYESKFTEFFPLIKTRYIPPYTEEAFNFYQESYLKFRKRNSQPSGFISPIKMISKKLQYFPHCDFFSLGLTCKQIETLILNHKKNKKVLIAHTTGFNIDLKLVKFLSLKYPGVFRLHLSIITFDSKIRRNIMHPKIDMENLKKICEVALGPIYFLLYFSKSQVVSDIDILNNASIKNKGHFYIHRLFYNKLSPPDIIDYSDKAENEFEGIIYYLMFNDKKLKNISRRIEFSPHSKIYAWHFRKKIKELLRVCKNRDDGAIFCSQGAYPVIQNSVGEKAHVVAIKNRFGGCVDFICGVTLRDVLSEISRFSAKGIALKDIYIPSSMFCIEKRYDLNGDSVKFIKTACPKIKTHVLRVPPSIIHSTLTLDDCMRYYINHI